MSIAGFAPYYLLAHRRDTGLIDYVLMNPRGWGRDDVKHVSSAAARDEVQMLARVENLVPPWQEAIEWKWVTADVLKQISQESTSS